MEGDDLAVAKAVVQKNVKLDVELARKLEGYVDKQKTDKELNNWEFTETRVVENALELYFRLMDAGKLEKAAKSVGIKVYAGKES